MRLLLPASAAVGALLLLPAPVLACPVCFGAGDGAVASASNVGIAVLLAVTVAVLAGFAAFFLRLRRGELSAAAARSSDTSRAAAAVDSSVLARASGRERGAQRC